MKWFGGQSIPPGEDLINAGAMGDLPLVRKLLAANTNVNATIGDGVTTLMLASAKGYQEVVQALVVVVSRH